jgi:hypothetical protein
MRIGRQSDLQSCQRRHEVREVQDLFQLISRSPGTSFQSPANAITGTKSLRQLLPLLLLTLIAATASAGRTEFVATLASERLSGSNVCFFPAKANDGFFEKFLSSGDVRCLSGDAVIDMPGGNWNIFVEHERGYTSTHPTFQFGNGDPEVDSHGYRRVAVTMRPAARVRFSTTSLGDGVRPVVYFPNLGNRDEPATIRPLMPSRDYVLVPASTPVVPLLVRGTRIVQVGEPVVLQEGTVAEAFFRAPQPGRRDVVALMRVLGELEEAENREDRFELTLETRDGVLAPLVSPRSGLELDRSLAIFRAVPAGEATIVIGGRRWASQRIAVPAAAEAIQVLETPIGLRRAGEVLLNWTIPEAIESATPCRVRPEPAPVLQVRIEKCDPDCQLIRETPLGEPRGTSTIGDLSAGKYRVSLKHTRFGTSSRDVEIRRGATADADLELRPITITGSVKLGDEHVAADVLFVNGSTTTDMNGRYVAVLASAPGPETVTVLPCGTRDEYVAVPPEPLADGSVFDIAVPRTILNVAVHDAQTGAPLEGAKAIVAVLFERDGDEHFFLETAPTTKQGQTTIRRIAPEKWLRVCASQSGYKGRCSESFKLAADEEKAFRMDLAPESAMKGRVIANGPIARAFLYWMSPNGSVTERRFVAEDGTFTTAVPHAPDEYIVFVASNHPLHILRGVYDPVTNGLTMTLPATPVRQVTLLSGTVAKARIALEVDGHLVPEHAFSQHQSMRGLPVSIQQGATVLIRDIAARQWSVLVGPPTDFLPPGSSDGLDLSTVPQFRAMFRRFPVQAAAVAVQ